MKISETPHPQRPTATTSAPQAKQAADSSPAPLFSPGDLVKAKVMGLTQDGKVVLDVNGRAVTAQSLVDLKVGSELWLEIARGGSLPLLALAGKKGAVQDLLKLIVSLAATPPAPAGKPQQPLSSPVPPADPLQNTSIPARLLAALQTGEADPAAVKTLAAILSSRQPALKELIELVTALSPKKSDETVRQSPENLTTRLMAAHQEVNSQPAREGGQNFYLFPCFFAGSEGWGEWLLALEKGEKQESHGYTLSFFLEMSGLGPLTIHAAVTDKAINGEFCLRSEDARRHLAAHLPELCAILESRGFRPASFSCRLDTRNMMAELKEKLEQKTSVNRFALVDLNV